MCCFKMARAERKTDSRLSNERLARTKLASTNPSGSTKAVMRKQEKKNGCLHRNIGFEITPIVLIFIRSILTI